MSGKNFQLTALASRKQLLLVESELNRAQLVNELRDLQGEIQQLKAQAQAIGALAASAAKLADTISAIGGAFTRRREERNGKPSWVANVINAARTGASLWETLRSQRK
jgi:hypothetical protein